LHVPELGQEGVFVVVATARYHPPFFVEVADFTEASRQLAPGWLGGTEWAVIGAYGGELNDNSAIRECVGPCLGSFSELISTIQRSVPAVIGVGKALDRVADHVLKITPAPAFVLREVFPRSSNPLSDLLCG
jgi:hypothetical protein